MSKEKEKKITEIWKGTQATIIRALRARKALPCPAPCPPPLKMIFLSFNARGIRGP